MQPHTSHHRCKLPPPRHLPFLLALSRSHHLITRFCCSINNHTHTHFVFSHCRELDPAHTLWLLVKTNPRTPFFSFCVIENAAPSLSCLLPNSTITTHPPRVLVSAEPKEPKKQPHEPHAAATSNNHHVATLLLDRSNPHTPSELLFPGEQTAQTPPSLPPSPTLLT